MSYLSLGDHFADWCEHNLIQSEDVFAGQPLILEPWQRRFFDRALRVVDEKQLEPYWRRVALIVARKNGKTALLAAFALYRLFHDVGRPEILLAAASDHQASKLFDACINYLRKNPELDDAVRRREYVGEIVNIENGGKIQRVPSGGETLDGANPSLVIADELHGWDTPTRQRTWTSLSTGGGARTQRQLFTITTAGDASQRHASILGRLIDTTEKNGVIERPEDGLTIAEAEASRTLLFNYSAPTTDPFDVVSMQKANPASWITDEFLLEQANSDLTDAAVLQLHGCVWAETETTFVAPQFIAQAQEGFVPLEAGSRVVLGFDGSERRDETWLSACSLEGHIEPLGRWARPPGNEDWRVPRLEVHKAVAAAFDRFEVVEFAFDPPGWYSEGDQWAAEYGERVVFFDTNKPARFAPACERMRAGLQSGETKFGGPLAGRLAEHFGNCVTRETAAGIVVEKDYPDSPRKVDGAVASIIAFDRAMWHAANPADGLALMVSYA